MSSLSFVSSIVLFSFQGATIIPLSVYLVVGSNGLEPSTSRLSAECSNQLSYEPLQVVEIRRIELLTSGVQGRRSPS